MARPKQQDARRELMVAAAGRAISSRGLTNVRVKDIAEEAGMSAGSVHYYYPEIDQLIFEVHQQGVNDYHARRLAAVQRQPRPPAQLVAAIEAGLPQDPPEESYRLLYELHRLADHSSPHTALMTSLFEREVAMYSSILATGAGLGDFTLGAPPHEIASNLIALEDGYGLHVASRNPGVRPADVRRLIVSAASRATGCYLPDQAATGSL